MTSTPPPSGVELERALFEVKRVIVGQDRLVERMMVALLARGHCLLEGVPGVAKTLAVQTLARVVGGSFARIQFTPDLVPSDVVGTRIYRPSTEGFDVELGPVFANFVLADEVNRAPAKVQSALLEVMAERQVSLGGASHPVPDPFLVLATQNPIESEGVYQLPEAQRDRFLMKIHVPYPTGAEELAIVARMSVDPPQAHQALSAERLRRLQAEADQVFVHHAVADYAVRLVLATRDPAAYGVPEGAGVLAYGAGPRASLGLVAAGRALALLRGRDYVLPVDVRDVAEDVLPHRLVLSFDALADGIEPREVVARLVAAAPEPRVAPHQSGAPVHPAYGGSGGQPAYGGSGGQPAYGGSGGQPAYGGVPARGNSEARGGDADREPTVVVGHRGGDADREPTVVVDRRGGDGSPETERDDTVVIDRRGTPRAGS